MRHRRKKEFGLEVAISCSLLAHLAFFAAFSFLDFFSTDHTNAAPVYYVDMVNLPVANPRAGSPLQRGSDVMPASPETPKEMQSPV
ncbi:MAG: energy transducer TonB, partial [Deltaproteobacteria bacterium]